MIFSSPLMIIFVESIILKQIPVQYPISLPPNNTIFEGKNSVGIKIIEIREIPRKKKNKNKYFLIILIKI